MHKDFELIEKELTYTIRGCVFEVFRELGAGYLESVYESALAVELSSAGLSIERQKSLNVFYKQSHVGHFIADLIVEGKIMLELKALNRLLPVHEAQLLNYLKATNMRVGLLINFTSPRAEIKRLVL